MAAGTETSSGKEMQAQVLVQDVITYNAGKCMREGISNGSRH